jgi:spermidine synthase
MLDREKMSDRAAAVHSTKAGDTMLIPLLFFCSGATALVYEVLWSKYLALLFGSTVQAQTVVLAVFMGGLALGNKWFSRGADRAARPLAIYGRIELAIGVYALLFSFLYALADRVFVGVGSGLLEHRAALLFLKGALSVLLLGLPTVLMGGTLPVLAAWLQRHAADAGRGTARFYAINSLGAVCGAGVSAFILVPSLGMPATIRATAVANIVVGLAALLLAGRAVRNVAGQRPRRDAAAASSSKNPVLRWACIVVALSGAVSMGLEVLASRCLALIFGSSLQAFAIVLMAFILGIGLGSVVVASLRFQRWTKNGATVLLLLAATLLIGLVVGNLQNLVEIYRHVRSGLSSTVMGYHLHQIFVSVMAVCVLGLPAGALGAVLPLWIRIVSETSDLLGDRVGRLLTWNTLGAVAGVLVTGFCLMPLLGLRNSFAALAFVSCAAAIVTAFAVRQRAAAAFAGLAGLGLLVLTLTGGEGWRYALTAGVFRVHETGILVPISERSKVTQMLFYEDAADATVSVERDQESPTASELVLRINGKGDASSHGDLSTQILLGQLPLMMKPGSKDVFCFGMGSGITAGTVLGHPIDHLSVAENCQPVLRAAKLFEPWNQGVLRDPRVRIYPEDARTVLKLSPQKYDAIISEPSNPWMANVGSVFSYEFYRIAADRLKPGGIMTQWFHLYEIDDQSVDLVLRTFNSVFPAMEIWDVGGGDIVLLGSDRPWESTPAVYGRVFAFEKPRHDLEAIGLGSPEAVLARQLASQRTAYAVPNPGAIQHDDYPILEYAAPRAMYVDVGRQSQRLQRFDERTWQSNLASTDKNRVLSGLDDGTLRSVFCQSYGSVDPGLQYYIRMRVENVPPDFGLLAMPCVFRGTNDVVPMDPPNAPQFFHDLAQAEIGLERPTDERRPAVEEIANILENVREYNRQDSGWSAGYYAYLAAEVSLKLGDPARAKAILSRGLQLDPQSEELNYLSRILEREGVMKSSAVAARPLEILVSGF